MTLNEAIKIETINNDHNPDYTDEQRRQARQLGIEALKCIKEYRTGRYETINSPLSGETEDSTPR